MVFVNFLTKFLLIFKLIEVQSLSVQTLEDILRENTQKYDSHENVLDNIRDKTLKQQFQQDGGFQIDVEPLNDSEKDYDIVYLPILMEREAAGTTGTEDGIVDYSFTAFGEPIDLKLKRNEKLISPHLQTYIHERNGVKRLEKREENGDHRENCLYLHRDGQSQNVGAFSTCTPQQFNGLLFYNNKTLEILPLHETSPLTLEANDKYPHIIRKLNPEDTPKIRDALFALNLDKNVIKSRLSKRARNKPVGGYTLELAVFFDPAAYRIFAPYMNYDDAKLKNMIMAYLNAVQALYHHPSLGITLEIVIVRLDIMKHQPAAMPHYDGERSQLLDSFCSYQNNINPGDDSDVNHWDMAVYVSGLDFFAYENGRKSGVTMGLATVGGVCLGRYACVIAELGTTNVFGKPYPSAGFTSVYILAHEIGHNLGMHHDSSGNSCPKEGFIMSPSRGTNGETQWSTCSRDVMSRLSWAKCLQDGGWPKPELDQKQFADTPGQVYTAKKQCEILLTDVDAFASPSQQLSTICYNLQCKTPHRSGYYHSGPALEGTECGQKMYCFGGECVHKEPPKIVVSVPGGWGQWKLGACSSGCTFKSKGHQEKRRMCNDPLPINSDVGCDGTSFEVGLCNDEKICFKKKRSTSTEFASGKCEEFAKILPQLDPKGAGLQAPHEENRLWMGCAIFCRRANTGSYYTPRIELNDLGVSPYFPDGTWCHSDSTGEYYCLQHHCLPEHFQFTKSFLNKLDEDIPFSQNAQPGEGIPHDLEKYLSLDADGKPLKTAFIPGTFNLDGEDVWETNDYVELPPEVRKLYLEKGTEGDEDIDFM